MRSIKADPDLELQIVATGMHLSETFGSTYHEIEKDGFTIDIRVPTISESDSPVGISESIALGIRGCAEAFNQLRPDLILVLGDRFEIFSAATAALVSRIPIAHIHGGETTEGLIDEAMRHSVTKMSHVHFAAAPEYVNRIRQLGEDPKNIYLVGGLGLDSIANINLLDKKTLEDELKLKFERKSLLVTFHPVTLENETSEIHVKEILKALGSLEETTLIITLPNADTGGRVIIKLIEEFVNNKQSAFLFKSLGQKKYFSCLQFVDGVIGNSSSGLIEVPSFRKGTINIGDRQRGRLKSNSVIDCNPEYSEILSAINLLYSKDFQEELNSVTNPYGEAGASEKIVKVIKDLDLQNLLKKRFVNIVMQ
jgi:GDP/UDP-N,N'-diacetylbacillosamine 2-epimerase (hydrolysing)